MLDRKTQTILDTAAGLLLRLADELREEGDGTGEKVVTDAANALLELLDLNVLRARGRGAS